MVINALKGNRTGKKTGRNIQFSPVTQSCLTLCDPMDCSTPGFPVHHQLPELALSPLTDGQLRLREVKRPDK